VRSKPGNTDEAWPRTGKQGEGRHRFAFCSPIRIT
jgi:hypothetical protein